MFRERRIPTILGFVLLLVGIAAGVYVVRTGTFTGTNASPDIQPLQVEISNITHDSFTVSWVTQEPTTGAVSYGEGAETEFVARDKRDIFDRTLNEYHTHWVQVVGLSPSKQYQFYIQSDGKRFEREDGQLYQVQTAQSISIDQQSGFTAYGQITDSNNGPAEGALVILISDSMNSQSTITDSQGKWSINLSAARTADLSQLSNLDPQASIVMKVQRQIQENATAKLSSNQLQPAPNVQLGRIYDFSTLPSANEEAETASSQFNFITDLGAVTPRTTDGVTIWNPQENEAVATTQPLFIGTAPSNTNIELSLTNGEEVLEGTVQADERGNWQWTASSPLASGSHSITAQYTNASQTEFQVTRRFTVLSNDLASLPAIESTPSSNLTGPTPTLIAVVSPTATLTPTRVPTNTPTRVPTNTQTPTGQPTGATTPTASPTTVAIGASTTVTPTATSTPTVRPTNSPTTRPTTTPTTSQLAETTTTPTPTTSLPQAGTTMPTILLAGFGILVLLVGMALLL